MPIPDGFYVVQGKVLALKLHWMVPPSVPGINFFADDYTHWLLWQYYREGRVSASAVEIIREAMRIRPRVWRVPVAPRLAVSITDQELPSQPPQIETVDVFIPEVIPPIAEVRDGRLALIECDQANFTMFGVKEYECGTRYS